MKLTNFRIKKSAPLLLGMFALTNFCLAQDLTTVGKLDTNDAPGEFHPTIRGAGSNDVISARQVNPLVFFNNQSGQAIIADSTNDVCLVNGRLFTVTPAGPSQGAFINISQPFGTNEFSAGQTLVFKARVAGDYFRPDSPHRKFIDLESILHSEDNVRLAQGKPLRHTELVVVDGKLVLYFESYTHIKGQVVLDDQLNPISMVITSAPIAEAPQQPHSQPPPQVNHQPRYK